MSRPCSRFVGLGLVGLVAVGCVPVANGTSGTGGSGGSVGVASSPASDPQCVPAAVRSVLTSCTSCHGSSPRNGLPALVTVADFQAASPYGGTYGDRSVLRMKSASSPMPPGSLLPSADVTTFQSWVDGGYEMVCAAANTTSATGTGGGGGAGGTGSTGTGVASP